MIWANIKNISFLHVILYKANLRNLRLIYDSFLLDSDLVCVDKLILIQTWKSCWCFHNFMLNLILYLYNKNLWYWFLNYKITSHGLICSQKTGVKAIWYTTYYNYFKNAVLTRPLFIYRLEYLCCLRSWMRRSPSATWEL